MVRWLPLSRGLCAYSCPVCGPLRPVSASCAAPTVADHCAGGRHSLPGGLGTHSDKAMRRMLGQLEAPDLLWGWGTGCPHPTAPLASGTTAACQPCPAVSAPWSSLPGALLTPSPGKGGRECCSGPRGWVSLPRGRRALQLAFSSHALRAPQPAARCAHRAASTPGGPLGCLSLPT